MRLFMLFLSINALFWVFMCRHICWTTKSSDSYFQTKALLFSFLCIFNRFNLYTMYMYIYVIWYTTIKGNIQTLSSSDPDLFTHKLSLYPVLVVVVVVFVVPKIIWTRLNINELSLLRTKMKIKLPNWYHAYRLWLLFQFVYQYELNKSGSWCFFFISVEIYIPLRAVHLFTIP